MYTLHKEQIFNMSPMLAFPSHSQVGSLHRVADMELYVTDDSITILDTRRIANPEYRQATLTDLTREQIATILFLFTCGESSDSTITTAMYLIAEPVLLGLPQNLRPIP